MLGFRGHRGMGARTRPFSAPQPCHATFRKVVYTPSVRLAATKTGSGAVPKYVPTSAKDAIERGTQVFKDNKDYAEAVRLYTLAMEMKPNDDEARAALYNMGCAQAKLKQWKPAADSILRAINDYSLKLSVALKDEDLKELQERREWADALMEAKGGLSRDAKINLRSEAKTPFRFPRVVFFGALALGAAAGLMIIAFRLVKAFQGGEGAPDLQETLQNFGINSAAFAAFSYLVYRDVQGKEKTVAVTEREEYLGRLQIDLGGDRVLPLVRFRGQVRPVIISGSRRYVESVLKAAENQYTALRERGVSVIPLILDEVETARRAQELGVDATDPDAKIRALKSALAKESEAKGFGGGTAAPKAAAGEKVEKASKSSLVGNLVESDKKWRLQPYQIVEWKDWVDAQREFANLPKDAKDVWVQIQLDGTVRSSGQGQPPWKQFVSDLPELDSIRTRFTDGVGPSI